MSFLNTPADMNPCPNKISRDGLKQFAFNCFNYADFVSITSQQIFVSYNEYKLFSICCIDPVNTLENSDAQLIFYLSFFWYRQIAQEKHQLTNLSLQ